MIKSSRLLGAVCASLFCFISIPSHAALVDNGGGLIYDDVLDITWGQPDNVNSTWDGANAWAMGQTVGGVTGRLPTDAEYLGLFTALGGVQSNPLPPPGGTGDPALLALFPDLQTGTFIAPIYYWVAPPRDENVAFIFTFYDGITNIDVRFDNNYKWAVFEGNVSAVPIPAAVWLFGSGLLGLIGITRRKKAA